MWLELKLDTNPLLLLFLLFALSVCLEGPNSTTRGELLFWKSGFNRMLKGIKHSWVMRSQNRVIKGQAFNDYIISSSGHKIKLKNNMIKHMWLFYALKKLAGIAIEGLALSKPLMLYLRWESLCSYSDMAYLWRIWNICGRPTFPVLGCSLASWFLWHFFSEALIGPDWDPSWVGLGESFPLSIFYLLPFLPHPSLCF